MIDICQARSRALSGWRHFESSIKEAFLQKIEVSGSARSESFIHIWSDQKVWLLAKVIRKIYLGGSEHI